MDDRKQICKKLIEITWRRIADALNCEPTDLPELSLGKAINLLFLIRGEANSVGEYGATMASSYAAVGDLLWRLPSEFTEDKPQLEEMIN